MPVFAGVLRAHLDSAGRLLAVNGTVIPGLDLDVTPSYAATDASAAAIRMVSDEHAGAATMTARSGLLMVYRAGLVRGQPGATTSSGRSR